MSEVFLPCLLDERFVILVFYVRLVLFFSCPG